MLVFRFAYPRDTQKELKVTTWDAFGYYMYNPSIFIYGDVSELKWVPTIEEQYKVTGGELYQASKLENGNYTNKYLGGVAIMQMPFFFVGHSIASLTDYPADGFSAPYQYSIAFGALFYCLLGLLLLRKVLARFFRDGPIAITILFVGLGTNLIQYTAIDGGQSHIYIFPLYALILWCTIKWHESPHWKWAALIGFTIGLATICRPTELIMLFIPLLWNTHEKEMRKQKWAMVRKHLPHLGFVVGFGLLGILPQLLYWQYTTGSLVHNVGSKWFFFNPWFRVLFGVTNGFFVYTPIVILFVIGFFHMKKYPFQRAVLTFCLLNIWIIISWSDWRYGATYSTRAMVQSYPVFALAMCAGISAMMDRKIIRLVVLNLGAFFIYANIFQITQYNSMVLHYHDMNWAYYNRIYLNWNPQPIDFSLLDHNVFIDEGAFRKKIIYFKEKKQELVKMKSPEVFAELDLKVKYKYVKVEVVLKADYGFESNFIEVRHSRKQIAKVRLKRPLADAGKFNKYALYAKTLPDTDSNHLSLRITGWDTFNGEVKYVKVTSFY